MQPTSTPPSSRSFGAGDLYLLAASFAWGINFPIAKSVLSYMDPLAFSATRYLVASLFLFLLLIIRRESLKITWKEGRQLLLIGFIGITLFQGGWAFGLDLTSASKASILVSTAPIFGVFIALLMGEKITAKVWLGILLSLFGVFILINNSLTEITLGGGSLIGDLLIMSAAALWAIYTVVSGPMVMLRGPILVTAWGMLFGALLLCLISAPSLAEQNWLALPSSIWIAWGSTAVLSGSLAFVWYCAGISRIGATKGLSYGFFIPAVAIATSLLFFGESMSFIQLGGAMIILAGVKLTRSA